MSDIKFEREVSFIPAFDRRDPDPKKNYGIHGVDIRFYLKGPHGAVQFILSTNWQLPHVQKETDTRLPLPDMPYLFHQPMAVDLGYHSKIPIREGQTCIQQDCEFTSGPCYYDGSTLEADRIFNILREEGDKGVWRELAIYYRAIFFDGVREATFGETMHKFMMMLTGELFR